MTALLALKRSARALLATAGLAMGLLVAGCGGGGGSDAPVDPSTPTGTLSGTVVSARTGETLAGVQINAGARSAISDAAGHYTLTDVPAADPVVVSFALTNHATTFASVPLSAQTSATANARLVPVSTTGTVAAAAGGTVAVPNSTAQVTLPAGGLVNSSSGAAATGTVTVALTVIDPAANPGNMPGNYTTNTGTTIESFGALTVTLQDAAGQKLNLAAGQTATIRIPVSTRAADTPATIPLYYFNESTGRWVQEGTATLVSQGGAPYYEGTVGHFSTWNCDRPTETIFVRGCVVDAAGNRQSGVLVQTDGTSYSGNAARTTDANGEFVVPMQKNGIAALWGERDARFTNVLTVGPSSVDINLLGSCLVLGSNVGRAPQIVSPPQALTVVPQGWASFDVVAIGTQPLSYQWLKNGSAINGATSASLWIYPVSQADDGASYTVTVSNAYGSVTSTPAVLTVSANVPPSIVTAPADASVVAGSTATFSVVALSNGGTLSYQWLKNGNAIGGATAASHTTPATALADNGAQYAVRVSSSNGTSVTSNSATLSVSALTAPAITQQPLAASVSVGQSASFSVTATGSPAPSYQWRRNGSAIAGATAASYTTPAATLADNGAGYSVVVSNSAGSVTSNAVALSVTQVVTQSGYHVVSNAGPSVSGTITFADGVQTINSQALVATNSDHPGAGAITLEPAGQVGEFLTPIISATFTAGQITQARSRYVVYAKGSRFYKVDQVSTSGSGPLPALLSNLSTAQVCGNGASADPLLNSDLEATDFSNPARSWLFVKTPGPDAVCDSADDITRAIRVDMGASDTPLTLSAVPMATINDPNTGALTGFIVLSGNAVQRVDANFGAATTLYTVNASQLRQVGRTSFGSAAGVWVYAVGDTVYALNLANPVAATAIATLASGEFISGVDMLSATGAFYLKIDGYVSGSGSISRVIKVSTALVPSAVATFSGSIIQLELASSRLVAHTSSSVLSVPLSGGTPATVYQAPAGHAVVLTVVSGDTVYAQTFSTTTLASQVAVFNSDGSNLSTLANTAVVGQLAAPTTTAGEVDRAHAVLLASPVASVFNHGGATVRAVNGATRATLLSYGALPALTTGASALNGYGGFQYGMANTLAVVAFDTSTGLLTGSDVYSLRTDTTGLARETQFLSSPLAAPRAQAAAATSLRALGATAKGWAR